MGEDLVTKFNKDIKSKNILISATYRINHDNILETITKLSELKYNFTQKNFDDFILAAICGKKNSFLVNFVTYNQKIQQLKNSAINIFFKKFNPNKTQMAKLLACYESRPDGDKYWVDILVSNNYQFSPDQLSNLQKIGYDLSQIYIHKPVLDISNNIYEILLSVTKSNNNPLNFLKIINNTTINIPADLLDFLLLKYKPADYNIIDILLAIIKRIKPAENTIKILKQNNIFNFEIHKILLVAGLKPTYELLDFYSENLDRFKKIADKGDYLIIFCLNSGINPDLEIFNKLLLRTLYLIGDLNNFKNIYEDKQINIYKLLLAYNIKPNLETLNCILYHFNHPNFNLILDDLLLNQNIIPNNNTLDHAIKAYYREDYNSVLQKILNYKIIPNYKNFKLAVKSQYFLNILNILIISGFELKPEYLDYILSYEKFIPNLSKYNILHDEKLYFYCHINNYFPPEYSQNFNIDPKILEFRKISKFDSYFGGNSKSNIYYSQKDLLKLSLDNLENYMKSNNLKFDRYIMDNLIKSNQKLGLYLIKKYNYSPNILTFYNYEDLKLQHKKIIQKSIKILKIGLAKNNFDYNIMLNS